MRKKTPPEVLAPIDLAYMSRLNERDRRRFLASKAADLNAKGFSYREVSKKIRTSTHTIKNSLRNFAIKMIRKTDASADLVPVASAFSHNILNGSKPLCESSNQPHIAGLPQNENVVWISMTITQIMNELAKASYELPRHYVSPILDSLRLRERTFYKNLPMKEVKNRNEQFERIASIREAAEAIGLPIISIDTKKKEMLGNFKRNGKALSNGHLEGFEHDFSTFCDGMIVLHGISMTSLKMWVI